MVGSRDLHGERSAPGIVLNREGENIGVRVVLEASRSIQGLILVLCQGKVQTSLLLLLLLLEEHLFLYLCSLS